MRSAVIRAYFFGTILHRTHTLNRLIHQHIDQSYLPAFEISHNQQAVLFFAFLIVLYTLHFLGIGVNSTSAK
jgi:hypothetical protein